ncbi:hypothetical protein LTR70_003700 [Exophiala xenobiotica]|uniref:Uncharacterized protein n=1 Tax=Lithohypha guttulata TaxID=1690604 RepID=A0ABR0KI48_9EURO|nr:hypothetical protein LTR24_002339 [Lithohypha guttulata]KAK5322752.1 hypothetical protein LTR70_003700 [Exophiala xenobiotica]
MATSVSYAYSTESITSTATIPQTTIFSPPSGCLNSWTYEAQYFNSIPGSLMVQNMLSDDIPYACFPPGFNSGGRAPTGVLNVYSPGVCPPGYSATVENILISAGTTTIATCCYSGFSYLYTLSEGFGEDAPTSTFVGCLSSFSGSSTLPGRDLEGSLNTTSVSGEFTMWAQPLYVQHQSADMKHHYTIRNIFGTIQYSITRNFVKQSFRWRESWNWHRGLLGVLALIGVVVFIIRHRRHRQQQRQPEHGTSMNKHELSNNGMPRPYEKDGSGVSHAPVEMSTEHERKAELAGNSLQKAEANARPDAARATKAS